MTTFLTHQVKLMLNRVNMANNIDRTPKKETLRKYYPDSSLTDDELLELVKAYAKIAGMGYVRPSKNKGFRVLVGFAEKIKKKHGELKW